MNMNQNEKENMIFSSPSDRKNSIDKNINNDINIDINSLIKPMFDLQVNNIPSKRSIEQRTIEGSPFHPSFYNSTSERTDYSNEIDSHIIKRLDISTTPAHTLKSITLLDKNTNENNRVIVISSGGEHDTGIHQENALRTSLLVSEECGCLHREPLKEFIVWDNSYNDNNKNVRYPAIVDLLRVHEYNYLNHLENKVKSASTNLPSFYAPTNQLDSDTPLGIQSLDAAKRYCGAVMTAVDIAMNKHSNDSSNRLLVIGRPPGHHAGPNGCVVSDHNWKRPDMTSSGFCLLNTVAVAAAYARCHYGSTQRPPKIAIIDIDIHHGNGTEEIIRNLTPHQIFLPLPSSWAPVSQLSYKPWLNERDYEEVMFASINLYAGDRFYPCSGSDNIDGNIVNISLSPIGPGPWDQKQRSRLTQAVRYELCRVASEEFRSKVSEVLLPKLTSFQADLIFLSSGFDGHVDDFYHFLTESDYHWITDSICQIDSNTPVISVLEGGYSLSSPITTKGTRSAEKNHNKDFDKFCQKPGDGGLVKGVLAHVAALAGKSAWT